eukprot:NODE_4226_length_821_cov_152.206052_g4068_i0.p1 GENE.NODE_4226_length_821_cov_152.206052_g4068_i0~~NODE_4226_length_821_cov_152.206052_g4068_i0.p1  ORF type:complete len:248 (-),score=65.05 NODE_4226_length_821_cov_152.206052_g4068_i0:78-764(-)
MVKKGNAPVPNNHFHKHWHPSAAHKGHVKVYFGQAIKKIKRRQKRKAKALKLFPRPVKPLFPIVRCPTAKHNMRTRLGKGFTIMEIKAAGLPNKHYARSIGIAVDPKRTNKSEEGLEINVDRLKTYLSKLVFFPRKMHKPDPKKKEVTFEQWKALKQAKPNQIEDAKKVGSAMLHEPPRLVTSAEKKLCVARFLKRAQYHHKNMARLLLKKEKGEAEKKSCRGEIVRI